MTEFEASQQEFDPNAEHLFAEPPKWPKVVGVLSITFGSIAVLCGALMTASIPFFGSMMEPMLEGDPLPPTMQVTAIDWASTGCSMLANILLIVGGVSLVTLKPAARGIHLLYAVLLIVAIVLYMVSAMGKIEDLRVWAETYNNQMAEGVRQQFQAGGSVSQMIGPVVVSVISVCWPIFCLVWFGISKTKPSDITGASAPSEHAL